jgi:Ion channel
VVEPGHHHEVFMWLVGLLGSLFLIGLVLVDSFETMVLPRRVIHRFRFARLFYRSAWTPWHAVACRLPKGKRREGFLSVFGPLSLLALFTTWVLGLILGFGLLHWSLGTPLRGLEEEASMATYFYLSGGTFFTLGYGEVTPAAPLGRLLAITEAGVGLGFLAMVIAYLPVLSQAFSQREVTISLLDARAGSPPSAAQILLRLAKSGELAALDPFLAEWERWAAELLESSLSFPVLGYYRSQHDNQSWLAAITAVLDTCALLILGVKGNNAYQAQLTFAMARHAIVDLALVFRLPLRLPTSDRLPESQRKHLRQLLSEAGLELRDGPAVDARLTELRSMYEPFVQALAQHFLFTVPPIVPEKDVADNWQRSPWMPPAPGIGHLPIAGAGDDHFA